MDYLLSSQQRLPSGCLRKLIRQSYPGHTKRMNTVLALANSSITQFQQVYRIMKVASELVFSLVANSEDPHTMLHFTLSILILCATPHFTRPDIKQVKRVQFKM